MDLRFTNVYHTVQLHVVTFYLMFNAAKITTALLMWYTPKTEISKQNYSHLRLLPSIFNCLNIQRGRAGVGCVQLCRIFGGWFMFVYVWSSDKMFQCCWARQQIHQIHNFMHPSLSDFPKASWDHEALLTSTLGIYSMTRTNRPSKHNRPPLLSQVSYSVCKIAKTWNVSPGVHQGRNLLLRINSSASADEQHLRLESGEGGVMVWGCLSGDTVGDLFKLAAMFNWPGFHGSNMPFSPV